MVCWASKNVFVWFKLCGLLSFKEVLSFDFKVCGLLGFKECSFGFKLRGGFPEFFVSVVCWASRIFGFYAPRFIRLQNFFRLHGFALCGFEL